MPERIALLLAEDDERARVADVLAGLVGAAGVRSVEETFWAIRRLVESLAAEHPLMVVIDDIQWAEPLLLDLLEHLVEWVKGVAVALVCLARPELRDVRPAFTETGRRVADVLALDGLDSAATEALAAGLLGTDRLPPGLVDRLPSSTDGNPLFVRELVRMLVDDEVIRRVGDGWELTIDADAVDVPPTIQSLLGARVERLPGAERELLELASVVGAEFSLGALRELARDGTPITDTAGVHAAQGADRADRHLLGRRTRVPVPPCADPRRRVPAAAQDHPSRVARTARALDGRRRRAPGRRARDADRVPLRAGVSVPRRDRRDR